MDYSGSVHENPTSIHSNENPMIRDESSLTLTEEQMHPVYHLEDYLQSLMKNDDDDPTTIPVDAKYDEIIRVAEFLFGNTLLTAAFTLLDAHESVFTKVTSPHRSLWLVRGSSDVAYMCFVCDDTPDLYYCTCRSFLEKTTKKVDTALPEMCKHLLALKLIPALGITCPQLTLSDSEFAKLVLDRTSKGSY